MSRKRKSSKPEESHELDQIWRSRRPAGEKYDHDQAQSDLVKRSIEATTQRFNVYVASIQSVTDTLGKKLDAMDEKVEGFNEKIRKQRKLATGKLEASQSAMEERYDKLEDQVRNDKLQSIQILALFVAFFTFVSVQFQLFAVVKDSFTMIALSMVLLGALLLFVCLTHLGIGYFRQDSPKTFQDWFKGLVFKGLFWVGLAAVLVLGMGLYLAHIAQQNAKSQETQLQSVCKELGAKTEEAISKQHPTADFLKERYEHECTEAWVGK